MKKVVLSVVVLGSLLSDAYGMIVPVEQSSFDPGMSAFDVSSFYCASNTAGFCCDWGKTTDTSNFWSREEIPVDLEKAESSSQEESDKESWNASNDSDFWVEKSNKPIDDKMAWDFSLLRSLDNFNSAELQIKQSQEIVRSDSVPQLSIPRICIPVDSYLQNGSISESPKDSTGGALVLFDNTEVLHEENRESIDNEPTLNYPVTKLIGSFRPKEESVWGEKVSFESESQEEQKKEDFSQEMNSSAEDDIYGIGAASLASVDMRFLGKALRRVVDRAISDAASLMHFGSRVVFSAVGGPVVFVGLKMLGVGTVRSFTTAGAFAVSPFVISPVRMVSGSMGLAKHLSLGGYRIFQGARRLFSMAR